MFPCLNVPYLIGKRVYLLLLIIRWLGRLIVFGAFWCACTGYELSNGSDQSDEVNPIYYVFAISYLIRIVLIVIFAVMRRSGWVRHSKKPRKKAQLTFIHSSSLLNSYHLHVGQQT